MPWAGGLHGPELATRTAVAGAISNVAPWTCHRPTKLFAAFGLGTGAVVLDGPAEVEVADVLVDGWEPHAASVMAIASTTRPGHGFTVGHVTPAGLTGGWLSLCGEGVGHSHLCTYAP
jgi:hypothetical protein